MGLEGKGERHVCSLLEGVNKNHTLTSLPFWLHPATNNQFKIKEKERGCSNLFPEIIYNALELCSLYPALYFFPLFINFKFQQYCQDDRIQVFEWYLLMVIDEATSVTSVACKVQMLTGATWRNLLLRKFLCAYIVCSLQLGIREKCSLISCTDDSPWSSPLCSIFSSSWGTL